MKASEGKKKVSTKDKKHHEHIPSYLKNEATSEATSTESKQKHK